MKSESEMEIVQIQDDALGKLLSHIINNYLLRFYTICVLWRGKSRNFEDILSAFLNYSSSSKTDVESNINLTFPNFHLITVNVSKEYDHTGGGATDKAVEQAIELGCQRCPRVNGVQKKLLVKLIENYFIRKTGHIRNVNFETIEATAWDGFAESLNRRGPPKMPTQWKNCFYFMKNRIRRSVDLIRQNDASLRTNLSELDFKIYVMSSEGDFGASVDIPVDSQSNNFNLNADEESGYDYELDDNVNFVANRKDDKADLNFVGNEEGQNSFEEPDVSASQDQLNTETNPKNFGCEVESHRVIVADDPEQLEAFMNTSVILSDEEEPNENSETFGDENEENVTEIEACRDTLIVSNGNQLSETSQVKLARQSKIINSTATRIPEIQKERLVQLVQNNFLKAFGRFSAENGKHIKVQLWRDIANELNTLGPHRTGEQWKATFDNIKASAKAKLADDHNNIDGAIRKPLTRLEEKVLSICGIDALDGNQELGEAGFRYEKTVPAGLRVKNSTATREFPMSEVNQFEPEISAENNPVTQISPSLTDERGCDDNTTTFRSHDEYEETVLEDILREIREEESADNSIASRAVVSISPSQSALGENSTHGHNSRMSYSGFVSYTSVPSPGSGSFNIVDSDLRIRGSTNSVSQSEMGNLEGSSSMNNSCPARSTSAVRPPVSQNRENDVSGNNLRETPNPSSSQNIANDAPRLYGSSSSARGRFSPIISTQNESTNITRGRPIQGSQNRIRGVPLFRGSSLSARGRFSSITNIQRSNDGIENDSTNITRGRPSLQGTQNRSRGVLHIRGSSARGRFSPITNIQRPNDGVEKEPTNITRGRLSLQGSQNRVRGVPRLRVRGSSSSTRGRFSPITNIQQFFSDNDDDDEDELGNSRHERANGSTVVVARDRSSLRHKYTSYEMVSRSIDAQEEFIEQDMRNHSEVMYATERNHLEMIGIFNSTLSTLANVAQEFVSRM